MWKREEQKRFTVFDSLDGMELSGRCVLRFPSGTEAMNVPKHTFFAGAERIVMELEYPFSPEAVRLALLATMVTRDRTAISVACSEYRILREAFIYCNQMGLPMVVRPASDPAVYAERVIALTEQWVLDRRSHVDLYPSHFFVAEYAARIFGAGMRETEEASDIAAYCSMLELNGECMEQTNAGIFSLLDKILPPEVLRGMAGRICPKEKEYSAPAP